MVPFPGFADNLTIGSWYLVYTNVRHESGAAQGLHEQGYAVYPPKFRQRRVRGRLADVTGALFPRYLFVSPGCAGQSFAPVDSTPGVKELVRFGARAAGADVVGGGRDRRLSRGTGSFDGRAASVRLACVQGLNGSNWSASAAEGGSPMWFRPAGACPKPASIDLSNDEIHYRILRELERDPRLSQRQLADSLGVSVGKTNYCVRALVEKGLLKVENFRRSRNKLAYAYHLTPRGLAAKARITRRFLEIKQKEYEVLREEIDRLQREVGTETPR